MTPVELVRAALDGSPTPRTARELAAWTGLSLRSVRSVLTHYHKTPGSRQFVAAGVAPIGQYDAQTWTVGL